MTKVLVTGYGGFLGAAVTRQLLQAGYAVRGIARGHYGALAELGVECIQGDITDSQALQSAVEGCDAIVHTAAKAGVWGPWEAYYRINTQATLDLLQAAKQHGVSAFVHTSSPSVTFAGQPQSGVDESVPYPQKWLCFYPHTKALAEQAVLEAAQPGPLKTCALRPHLIWGQGDPHLFPRVIQRTLAGRLRCVGDGKNLIDIVHVDAAARAHVQAVEKLLQADEGVNGEAFFLTDGQPLECWAWLTQILETAGVAVPTQHISYAAAYRIGGLLEAAYWTLRRQSEPPMTRFVAAQLAQDHYFSIHKAQQRLGYDPQVDRAAVMRDCTAWLQGIAAEYSRR